MHVRTLPLALILLCVSIISLACGSSQASQTQAPADSEETREAIVAEDASPTPFPTATPTPAPPPPPVLQDRRVISYYGHPFSPVMGILGEASMEEIHARLMEQAGHFQAIDPAKQVLPAFHLIYAVAQASAGSDGRFLYHTDHDVVQRFIDFTRERDMLLFIDLQNGRADPVEEVRRALPYLAEPHVHLAMDPEFTWKPDQFPNVNIGSLDGHQINEAQVLLSGLVQEHNLPPKMLMVHQFLDTMVTNKEVVAQHPGVDVLFTMDGFGGAGVKVEKYHRYSVEAPARFRAIKLFYRWDVGLMSPADLLAIDPPPDLIVYQ